MTHVGGIYASCDLFGGGSRANISANVGGGRGPCVREPEPEVVGDEYDKTLGMNQSIRRLGLLLGRG